MQLLKIDSQLHVMRLHGFLSFLPVVTVMSNDNLVAIFAGDECRDERIAEIQLDTMARKARAIVKACGVSPMETRLPNCGSAAA